MYVCIDHSFRGIQGVRFQEFGTSKGTPRGRMDVQKEQAQLEDEHLH